jgi:hypothetical protein
VLIAQGSGRTVIEAMVDGLAEDHWGHLQPASQETLRQGMGQRWDSVIGYLTRESEGSVADIDCVLLTPRDATESTMEAGPLARTAGGAAAGLR